MNPDVYRDQPRCEIGVANTVDRETPSPEMQASEPGLARL
jgi:hypothetical protein